jgi:hypothetical protein
MKQRTVTRLIGASLVVCLALLAMPARADTTVNPGDAADAVPAVTYNNGGSPVAPGATFVTSMAISFTLGVNPGATATEAVYKEPSGTYDFLYQVTNATSAQAITSVTVVNYSNDVNTPFTTNTGYLTALPTGGAAFSSLGTAGEPATVERTTLNGASLTFSFSGTSLSTGQTSAIFYLRTNATNFNGNGTFQANAATSGSGLAFQPAQGSVVPEPSVIVMGLVGTVVIGGRTYLRRRKPVVA